MVHLRALPGSPGYAGDFDAVLDAAERDAAALLEGGADAVMLENFFDVPFYKTGVPPITVACLTAAAVRVRGVLGEVPLGINVLRNDGRSAVAIAAATGASYVRVNVLTGARLTDQGLVEGEAADILRDRVNARCDATIWADVDVKHSSPLAPRRIEDEVADTIHRGGAGALIVSGHGTGGATDPAFANRVADLAGDVPVLIGSGATADTAGDFPTVAGFIVGSSLKPAIDAPVDANRVRAFRDALAH